jgi:hypothetical protein
LPTTATVTPSIRRRAITSRETNEAATLTCNEARIIDHRNRCGPQARV